MSINNKKSSLIVQWEADSSTEKACVQQVASSHHC